MPPDAMRRLIKSLDPEGEAAEEKHVDWRDKLKPYGVTISGCIDVFSPDAGRKEADRTNNRQDSGTLQGAELAESCLSALFHPHSQQWRGRGPSILTYAHFFFMLCEMRTKSLTILTENDQSVVALMK